MDEKNEDFKQEYDSLKDVIEFQNNMFNPGYYVGTGKAPPTVSAPGNALPLAITCFLFSALCLAFGLFLFFSDVNVALFGMIKSSMTNKIGALIIMLVIALILLVFGCAYFKKAKKYYKEKAAIESEELDESVEDKLWQRTCPKCGESHDIDYPKCPNCNFNYLE